MKAKDKVKPIPAENRAEGIIKLREIKVIRHRHNPDHHRVTLRRTAGKISRLKDVWAVIPSAYAPDQPPRVPAALVIVRGVSPDHIHMLLSAPPHIAPAKLAQYIKGRSSRRLQEEFPELRKRYWGQHLWARGYFCATVGAVDEQTIKQYIENQTWDEDDQCFKITAPSEP